MIIKQRGEAAVAPFDRQHASGYKEDSVMATPMQNTQALIEKIQSLPTDRIAEVENFVDFLRQRARQRKDSTNKQSLNFPVDDLGPWPDRLSLHRDDMYGDNGR